jgi:hypothetical protein
VVELSTADSNKWLTLIEASLNRQKLDVSTTYDYQLLGRMRQQQRRLNVTQVVEMVALYQAGATVYDLAARFGCHRTTVRYEGKLCLTS